MAYCCIQCYCVYVRMGLYTKPIVIQIDWMQEWRSFLTQHKGYIYTLHNSYCQRHRTTPHKPKAYLHTNIQITGNNQLKAIFQLQHLHESKWRVFFDCPVSMDLFKLWSTASHCITEPESGCGRSYIFFNQNHNVSWHIKLCFVMIII